MKSGWNRGDPIWRSNFSGEISSWGFIKEEFKTFKIDSVIRYRLPLLDSLERSPAFLRACKSMCRRSMCNRSKNNRFCIGWRIYRWKMAVTSSQRSLYKRFSRSFRLCLDIFHLLQLEGLDSWIFLNAQKIWLIKIGSGLRCATVNTRYSLWRPSHNRSYNGTITRNSAAYKKYPYALSMYDYVQFVYISSWYCCGCACRFCTIRILAWAPKERLQLAHIYVIEVLTQKESDSLLASENDIVRRRDYIRSEVYFISHLLA